MKTFSSTYVVSLLAVLMILPPTFSVAAPAITNVSPSGILTGGTSVTIIGNNFGTKSPVAPLSWDNFESQTLGRFVSATPVIGHTWTTIAVGNGLGDILFSNDRSHSGNKAVKIIWYVGGNTINAFGWAGKGPYTRLYISYWRYQTGSYIQGQHNHKQFYVYGNEGSIAIPQALSFIPASESRFGTMNNYTCSADNPGWQSASVFYDDVKNRWNRWEAYVELNSLGAFDGTAEFWVDGKKYVNYVGNFKWRCDGNTGEWIDFRLGHMFQGPAGGPLRDENKQAWFDDVYIDTTPARVELCNESTWATRKHCEIQVPTAWSPSSINITLNKGSLLNMGNAYIYVVDANGEANASGVPICPQCPSPPVSRPTPS
jgi:hypothetical protein